MEPVFLNAGFREQRYFVLPEYMQNELGATELTKQMFVSDIGVFLQARHHHRERPEGADAHIFIYCVEGEGVVERTGQESITLKPGSLVVIPAGVPHRYWASETCPWSIYWFHLKGEHAREIIQLYELDREPRPLPRSVVSEFIQRVDQSLAMLTDRPYSLHTHVHISQTVRWLLSSIGHELLHASQDARRGAHLDHAIRYMNEHIATSIRLPELASYTGLSKQHLSHLFNKETGFSPIDYFLRMKMQHAAGMLDLTDLTVKEVAGSIGISDPYYFSRMFKKLMGHSPTEYRKIPKG
ncbi:transcriptional regulator [Paenibacillus sp. CCS19]|uniref:AraC family transcriptional regulator n=1 Tax=Paenibacillus sp. CCS19 TaxID=3158387 RepID=UPI00256B0AD3|nr:AraC family transcriptional regulator [Paenibacillus cellulosilyticus]GMK39192.1 transcriptional regulator [Paenibacillus cellulosilyticus]